MITNRTVTISKQLIAEGKTAEAVSQLLNFAEHNKLDKALTDNLVLLSARLNSLKQRNIKGIIPNSEYLLESNQITYSLLELIDNISDTTTDIVNNPKMDQAVDKNLTSIKTVENITGNNIQINIGNNNKFENIKSGSANLNSEKNNEELFQLIQDLVDAVKKMEENLSRNESEQISRALEIIVSESKSQSPKRQWWEVSVEGLSSAAKNLGKIGEPVLQILAKIIPILLSASK